MGAIASTLGATTSKAPGTIEGLAVAYDSPAVIHTPDGSFTEMIAPGALRTALHRSDAGDIAALRDHDASRLLARYGSRTLKLLDDSRIGLRVLAPLPATELGAETAALIRRGDLRSMSFSFVVGEARWHAPARGGRPVRVVTDVARLYDVSVVTYPAYPATTVALVGVPAPARSGGLAALRARHEAHARVLGPACARAAYGPPLRFPPPRLESWARRRPVRVGTEARAAR